MTTAAEFAAAAESMLGAKFAHKGATSAGMDCRGLVIAAASKCGVEVPWFGDYERNPDPAVVVRAVEERCDVAPWADRARAGSVIVMRHKTTLQPKHVAVSIGGGFIVHATDRGVRRSRLCDEFVHSVWHVRGVEY